MERDVRQLITARFVAVLLTILAIRSEGVLRKKNPQLWMKEPILAVHHRVGRMQFAASAIINQFAHALNHILAIHPTADLNVPSTRNVRATKFAAISSALIHVLEFAEAMLSVELLQIKYLAHAQKIMSEIPSTNVSLAQKKKIQSDHAHHRLVDLMRNVLKRITLALAFVFPITLEIPMKAVDLSA